MSRGPSAVNSPYHGMSIEDVIDVKRRRRMDVVDAYPTEVRFLIHDYGLPVVQTLWDLGVQKPGQIKHVVETVLDEFSPTRGSFARQGIRTQVFED